MQGSGNFFSPRSPPPLVLPRIRPPFFSVTRLQRMLTHPSVLTNLANGAELQRRGGNLLSTSTDGMSIQIP